MRCFGPGDVPHGDPMLGQLASNGGPTQTIALLPGSPALGAGGACTDPASVPANEPLLTDQRLLPRPSGGPCDIGAFQFQPVSVSAGSDGLRHPFGGQDADVHAGKLQR